MKNCLAIYKRDLEAIFKNYAAFVVILALCILPSLYAWFNIKASWDPYSEAATKGVKIGVVNEDKGTTLEGNTINIGDKVIEELKKNTQLGWQFVNADAAHEALVMGKYYATITLPSNFSQDLTSIVSSNIQKGQIIYTVNEKLNAIAPKLTDKGVSSLQNMISEQVVQTVSEVIFGVGNELGVDLESQIPTVTMVYNQLVKLQSKFEEINQTVSLTDEGITKLQSLIEQLEEDMPDISQTFENARGFTQSIQDFMNASKKTTNQIGPTIKQDIQIIGNIAQEISSGAMGLKAEISGNSEQVPALLNALQKKVIGLKTLVESMNRLLKALDKVASNAHLETAIDKFDTSVNNLETASNLLGEASENIEAAPEKINPILDQVVTVGNDLSDITTNLYNGFDDELMGPIAQIFDKAYETASNAEAVLIKAQNSLPEVNDLLIVVDEAAQKGEDGIAYVKQALPKAENMVNNLVAKIGTIQNEGDLEKIVELLKADVNARSGFLANPIEITEEILYPMHNYGTSMTPFYTVLCLWVGGLLLASMLTVEAKGEYGANEIYFGKLLLFVTIGIVQALIVSMGDLYLLKIYCKQPLLFVLSNCFVGLTFATLVYSLVSVFGNIGKVIAIILLVLQVAGSGGTFPIQMTPQFFQILNPFLPFTYGIAINREAIGGVVVAIYSRSISFLLIYLVGAILIAVVLKQPINQLMKKAIEKFKESEIGEH